MTAQEAIEYLELAFDNSDGVELSELYQDMCKTAIVALEEIQQYRATGLTPQMVNDLIKSEKNAHKIALENANLVDVYKTLEEQGLLLRLPVVEGTIVYTLSYFYECDCDFDCIEFYAYKCEEDLPCEHQYKKYRVKESEFRKEMLAVLGKTVFLTKEEAEVALEKM